VWQNTFSGTCLKEGEEIPSPCLYRGNGWREAYRIPSSLSKCSRPGLSATLIIQSR
jgi:hypothetical protein